MHTYTHGQEPHLVFDNATMNPSFQSYHWHFRAYRDFMAAIPPGLRGRPVYITETDQCSAWRDANTGWVRNAYREIDDWNQNLSNQPIQALVLFRWIIGNPNDPQQGNDDNWGKADVQFDSVPARYVRVQTTNSSPYHPWGIAEFVVWRSAPVWLVGREG